MEVSWLLFTAASLVLIVTPGQDMVLVMSRSIAQGAAAGVATAAGVSVGLVGHTVLVTLGLGAILRASEWLFIALKLVGAAYLLYLGIALLRTRGVELAGPAASKRSVARLFVDGALSNISNPKIAIFYFAFLPQFVLSGATHPTLSVFAGAPVRGAHLPRQGTGRLLRGLAVRVVALAPRLPRVALSLKRRHSHRARCQARLRAPGMKTADLAARGRSRPRGGRASRPSRVCTGERLLPAAA